MQYQLSEVNILMINVLLINYIIGGDQLKTIQYYQ